MSPRRQTGDNLVAEDEGMCFADVSEYAVGDKDMIVEGTCDATRAQE